MKKPPVAALLLSSALLSFSCNEGSNTIFYNIINDTAVSNLNQLGNYANVPSMTKIGGSYYAAVGVIRRRAASGSVTSWNSFTLADGIHYTVATDGTRLYGGVVFENASGGLYATADPESSSPTVTQITSLADLKYVVKIKNFGSFVFASYRKTDGTYSVCSISGTSATEEPGLDALDLADPISDFSFSGGTLYFVSGQKVYRGTTEITPAAGRAYTGITYDSGRLMAATNSGYIYYSGDNGNTWPNASSASQCTYTQNSRTIGVPFSEIVPVSSTTLYLAGSRGAGFWIIDWAASTPITRWNGSSYSELYNGAIEHIHVDTDVSPARYFFCTIGAGLWDNTYDAGWGGTWTRE